MSYDLLEPIGKAIFHGARAGSCRRAARFDVVSAQVWELVAQAETVKADAAIAKFLATAAEEPTPESWEDAVAWCKRRSGRLSPWQRNFIEGLSVRLWRDHQQPSEWQQKRLISIYQQLELSEGEQ